MTRVGGGIADAVDAVRLEVAVGRPILLMESINVDSAGVPVQWSRSHFSADRVRITIAN